MIKQLKVGNRIWDLGQRTYIMGILNVTPDSFSDGGFYFDAPSALEHAKQMLEDGADIIDVGGESTRPGYRVVPVDEEINRIVPVIKLLSKEVDLPVSVDTYKAKTAEAAILAGAAMLNDIWGLKKDPEMANVAAKYNVPICIMHNRDNTEYNNLIEDVLKELGESIDIAKKAGIKDENIIIDPGVGFGKTAEQNLLIMRHLEEFNRLGHPILLGTSRKSFIGKVLGDVPPLERDEGTAATTVTGIIKGVDIVRVHNVLQNKRAALMTDKMVR